MVEYDAAKIEELINIIDPDKIYCNQCDQYKDKGKFNLYSLQPEHLCTECYFVKVSNTSYGNKAWMIK